jgi:hypothetical protein
VLHYAGDFIPSWAGAISIDLMPAVLVLILCVVHAAIRREGLPAVTASTISAGDLVAALQIAREVEHARHAARGDQGAGEDNRRVPVEEAKPVLADKPVLAEETKPASNVADENVTSLSSARHTK